MLTGPQQENMNKIRLAVQQALSGISKAAMPTVLDRIQTPEGYAEIEALCIKWCCRDRLTPRQVLPEIESELSRQD